MRKFLITFLWVLLFCTYVVGKNVNKKRVLILHSYHQGLTWTDDVTRGLTEGFLHRSKEIDVFIEYLDTKRYSDHEYFNSLNQFYTHKLADKDFDVVVTVDNSALRFSIQNRDSLFKDVPIVFCGVNNFRKSMLNNESNITGIAENIDLAGTLDIVDDLVPEIEHLYVINDDKTETARENRKLFDELKGRYDFEFRFVENLSTAELSDTIGKIPENDAIILMTYSKDRDGTFMSFADGVELVAAKAEVPIFVTWEFYLGRGVLGGKLISGYEQGRQASILVHRILNGEHASDISILTNSNSKYKFDFKEMNRYHILPDRLPRDSVVVNSVIDFFTVNRKWIITGAIIIIVLFLMVVSLSNAVLQKRSAVESYVEEQRKLKQTLAEQKLIADIVTLLNAHNDFSESVKNVLELLGSYFVADKVSLFELSKTNKIGRVVATYFSDNDDNILEIEHEDFDFVEELVIEIKNRRTFVCGSLSELNDKYFDHFRKRRIGATIIHPISIQMKVIGMASLSKSRSYDWNENEINLFETIIKIIENAWERSVQLKQIMEAREKHSDALHMLEKSSKMASVGVIASGITHEIRQPLNAIKVTSDSIGFWQKRHPEQVPSALANKMQIIAEGANRIEAIIQQMRSYWIKPGQVEHNDIDLNVAVDNGLNLIERQILNHNINLVKELAHGVINIKGNATQLEQIVINLVVNAVNALDISNRDEKKIMVTTFKSMELGIIKVRDNGIGLKDQSADQLFDPFYSTKQQEEGTGLGLAIVKTFVDQMKGEIKYENNIDGGVTFTVSFALSDKF